MAIFGASRQSGHQIARRRGQYRQEPGGRTRPPDLAGPLAAGEAVHAGRHLGGVT